MMATQNSEALLKRSAAELELAQKGAAQLIERHSREVWLGRQLRHPHVVATYTGFATELVGERRTGLWAAATARADRRCELAALYGAPCCLGCTLSACCMASC